MHPVVRPVRFVDRPGLLEQIEERLMVDALQFGERHGMKGEEFAVRKGDAHLQCAPAARPGIQPRRCMSEKSVFPYAPIILTPVAFFHAADMLSPV